MGRGKRPAVQEVRYFGGVGGTVVGEWLFEFDYWMKQTSLSDGPAPVSGLPIYWRRSVEAMDKEFTTRVVTGQRARVHHNRFWLCTGEFEAATEGDTLTFARTPLRVLAESMPASGERTGVPASPCSSRGTDDPIAAEFAAWLTEHLAELGHVVPIREIHDFSRLLVGLTWLAERDPYRNLRPWFGAQVVVLPTLAQVTNGDEALPHLRQAVLEERPVTDAVTWRFPWWTPAS
jgi:hypothetical protein